MKHLEVSKTLTDLRQRGGEVVAVFVHEMVGVAFKLFAEFLHDFIHVLLCEVRGSQNNGLPGWKHRELHQYCLSLPAALKTSQGADCSGGTDSLEFEGLAQFGSVAGVDFKDAAEGVRVTPVGKFCVDKKRTLPPENTKQL